MIDDKLILAVVPARGGSKGIKLKNLEPILGMPMISYVGNCISSIKEIDRAIASTDNDEIAKVAKSAGLDVPFRRPEEISSDYSSDIDVLIHALQEIEKFDNKKYDIIQARCLSQFCMFSPLHQHLQRVPRFGHRPR